MVARSPSNVHRGRPASPLRAVWGTLRWALVIVAVFLCLGFVATFGVPGCYRGGPTRPPGPPPAADLARTDVVVHPESALVGGRNALWCASVQLMWDALADAAGEHGRLVLGPPAPAAAVDALNRRTFPHGDLDGPSYVAEAAQIEDPASVGRLRARLQTFGVPPPESLDRLRPGSVVAFSALRKALPFREPFLVHSERLSFAGGPAEVVTFGLDDDDRSERMERIARQAVLYSADRDEDGASPVAFAVELLPRSEEDRIVVATMPRPATLDAAWSETAALLAREGRPLSAGTRFVVPKVDFAATRVFDEFIGAPVRGSTLFVFDFRQRIELTLSEEGARLVSWAVGAVAGMPSSMVFDRPFLLALLRRGASRPYLLAWFENDDLFVKD